MEDSPSDDTSLEIDGFTKEGEKLSKKSDNEITTFSFINNVHVAKGATWKLYSDIEKQEEIITQTINLNIGDNTAYIDVTARSGKTELYTIVIRRLDIFTIFWEDEDGTPLSETYVQEEDMPVYDKETPTKPADAEFTYSFSGWVPDIVSASSSKTYQASYSHTTNQYLISWYNGTTLLHFEYVDYGWTPSYHWEDEPTKPETDHKRYDWNGWEETIVPVEEGGAKYHAHFDEVNKYLVTYKNYDGKVLQESYVASDKKPQYEGKDPTRDTDKQYTYEFIGWDKEEVKPIEDTVYTADYRKETRNDLIAHMELVIPETNDGFTFSFNYEGTEEIIVDWGDTDTINSTKSHTYTKSGEYDVFIYGEDVTSIKITEGKNYLTKMQFEEGITSISSFTNCTELTSINIPNSVADVDEYSFDGCDKLKYEIYEGCNYLGNDKNKHQLLVGPCEKTITNASIHNECKIIKDGAFHNCSSLVSVDIPEGVISLPKYMFCNCSALSSITIPNSVASIGFNSFYFCTGLLEVNFKDSPALENIDEVAFYQCEKLASIVIPTSVKNIGLLAFSNAKNLKEVDLTGFDVEDYEDLPVLGVKAFGNAEDIVFYVKNVYMQGLFANDTEHGWSQIDGALYKVKPPVINP